MNEPNCKELKQRIVRYPKGSFLFRQHDASKDLYIIKSGSVRIFKVEGIAEIDLDIAESGMVVGEVGSIDGGVRTASGMALEDTDVIVIPAAEFQKILRNIPEYMKKIALILVQRLREVDLKINRSIEGDRTVHVASVISLIAFSDQCVCGADGFEISLKFLENEIMDLLNIPLSEISEIIEKLEKKGYFKLEKTKLILRSQSDIDDLSMSLFSAVAETPTI